MNKYLNVNIIRDAIMKKAEENIRLDKGFDNMSNPLFKEGLTVISGIRCGKYIVPTVEEAEEIMSKRGDKQ